MDGQIRSETEKAGSLNSLGRLKPFLGPFESGFYSRPRAFMEAEHLE
jgi:hypothetical protein